MKQFLTLALLIPIVFGICEATQWWREPSLKTWFDASYFAIVGAGMALHNVWLDR